MAHRLRQSGSPKCVVPHGHNEFVTARLTATEQGRLDGSANMVVPFERVKSVWHGWIDSAVDHALQLGAEDPLLGYFRRYEPEILSRIMVFPGDPTTEILAACFKAKLTAFLAQEDLPLCCSEITVEETPTNTVRFTGDPQTVLPVRSDEGDFWWNRPDLSINDCEMRTALSVVGS